MSDDQTELTNAERPWYKFRLRRLLLIVFGGALIFLIAGSCPEFLLVAAPFTIGSVAGSALGRRQLIRTIVLGGIGGTLGTLTGIYVFLVAYDSCSSGPVKTTAAVLDDPFFSVGLLFSSTAGFLAGMGVAAAIWGVQHIRKSNKEEMSSLWVVLGDVATVDRLLRILGWILVLSAIACHFTYCEWRKVASSGDIIPFVAPAHYSPHFWALVSNQYSREVAIRSGFLVPAGMILLGVTAICSVSLVRCVFCDRCWEVLWTSTKWHWIILSVVMGILIGMYALVVFLGSLLGAQ